MITVPFIVSPALMSLGKLTLILVTLGRTSVSVLRPDEVRNSKLYLGSTWNFGIGLGAGWVGFWDSVAPVFGVSGSVCFFFSDGKRSPMILSTLMAGCSFPGPSLLPGFGVAGGSGLIATPINVLSSSVAFLTTPTPDR